MSDFTQNTYLRLLETLQAEQYQFQPLGEYLRFPAKKCIILRHDVDKRPRNSLELAKMEYEKGIRGVYYFRAVTESWDEGIIQQIATLGHEIGYHYENLAFCQGNEEEAYEDFMKNLDRMRELVPVTTIAMHGSPRSKYDPKDLWKKYHYKELEIIGEPYFDLDFSKVLYLSDTGRRWDGHKVSVRDHVNNDLHRELVENGIVIRSTDDLIQAVRKQVLPDQIMINVHPQRWHRSKWLWMEELISQNLKNVVKRLLLQTKKQSQQAPPDQRSP